MNLDFYILGPVEVRAGPRPLRLSGPRQQRVLAALLVDADRAVSLDRLVDVVWDIAPPSTARRQVQDLVTRLRRSFASAGAGAGTIVTTSGGYLLRLDGHCLDAARFTELVAAAGRDAPRDGALAAASLRGALALWRGPALGGSTGGYLAAAAAEWNERRLEAWEALLRIELALGRHGDVIPELTRLVAEHPDREALVGLLMAALNRAGRTADALRVYQDLRRHLADELGVDPGAEVRRMYLALLTSGDEDPSGSVAALTTDVRHAYPGDHAGTAIPVPAQLPAAVSAFTGRSTELDRLDRLLPGPDGPGHDTVVISAITGTAGIGKTALAVHWAHRNRAAFPDGQLYANLRGYTAGEQSEPLAVLARFLHALGLAPEQVPGDLEEAAGLYRSLLAGRRVLVLLDNAGHAEQVRPLLPGTKGCLALVTSRDTLTGLAARDGAQRLVLDALDPAEAHGLLSRLLGPARVAAEPGAATALARLCGHLPLALRIAAAILTRRSHQSIERYVADLRTGDRLTALAVDGDEQTAVRTAFGLSYQRQTAEARRMFRLIGLAPTPEVDAAEAAALADLPADEARGLLERLADAHMISEVRPERYSLHDLLRLYAADRAGVEEDPLDRAAATDRLYGYYLGRVHAAAGLLYPEKLRMPMAAYPPAARAASTEPGFPSPADALAWLDAHQPTLVAAVARAARQGPRRAAVLLADALRGYFWLRMHTVDWRIVAGAARTAAEADDDLAGRAAAELSLADAAMLQSDYPKAIGHYQCALGLHRRSGSVEGQSAVLGNLGNVYWRSGQLEDAAGYFQEGLALDRQIGWSAGQGVKLGNLGSVYRALGQLERSVEYHLQALAIDRANGSLSGEAIELSDLGDAYHALGRFEHAAEHAQRALRLNREVGDRASEAESLRILAAIQRDVNCGQATLDLVQTALALARDTGERRVEADVLHTLATIHHRLDRHDLAIQHHHRAVSAARRGSSPYTEAEAMVGLAEAHAGRGEHDHALRHAELALEASRRRGYRMLEGQARTARALALVGLGRPAEAADDAMLAMAIHQETGHRPGLAQAHHLLGRAAAESRGAPLEAGMRTQ